MRNADGTEWGRAGFSSASLSYPAKQWMRARKLEAEHDSPLCLPKPGGKKRDGFTSILR